MIDPQRFRETMATLPSGVVVLTAFGQDSLPRGLTVSAFCAVSLDPPLALACVDKTSNTLPAVQHAGGFTANILAAWRQPKSAHGGPILEDDCAAYAVCTLRDTIEAGDHWILIGNVVEGANRGGVSPMIFSRRGYFGL